MVQACPSLPYCMVEGSLCGPQHCWETKSVELNLSRHQALPSSRLHQALCFTSQASEAQTQGLVFTSPYSFLTKNNPIQRFELFTKIIIFFLLTAQGKICSISQRRKHLKWSRRNDEYDWTSFREIIFQEEWWFTIEHVWIHLRHEIKCSENKMVQCDWPWNVCFWVRAWVMLWKLSWKEEEPWRKL